MGKLVAFLYGIVAYLAFAIVIVYAHRLRLRIGGAENDRLRSRRAAR